VSDETIPDLPYCSSCTTLLLALRERLVWAILVRSRRDWRRRVTAVNRTARGGPPMSGTQRRPALFNYRDMLSERIKAGEPFGEVEDSIDAVAELTGDEKAALWLFAFSLRDPAEQQLDARAYIAALA
jgi:hypothetical protein